MRIGIITISDRSSRGEREDLSGPALVKRISDVGYQVVSTIIIPDDFNQIKNQLIQWCDSGEFDLILTTGGTGFSPRDVTPEATLSILEKTAPGIAEAMRAQSLKITPHAMLSRQQAGIRKKTLVINLPGSPKGAVENLEVVLPVLPHAIDLLQESPSAEKGHSHQK